MRHVVRLARRCRLTGIKLIIAYIAFILTLSLFVTIYGQWATR